MACATVSKEASDNVLTPPDFSPMLHPKLAPPRLQEKSSSCISLAVIKPQASGKDSVARGLSAPLEDILVLGLSQNYCEP